MRVQPLQRETTDGSLATGMLVGLWLGETLATTEYWLLRAADVATRMASWVFRRPALIVFACATGFVGGVTASVVAQHHDAQVQAARVEMRRLSQAAELYRSEKGHWPSTLQVLVPSYLPELRVDPWGSNYALYRGEGGIAIVSAGSDRELGSSDDFVRVIQAR